MKGSYAVKLIRDHYPNMKFDHVAEDLQRGSFVNVSRRYLYVQVSKVASTTMMDILRSVEHLPPAGEYDGTVQLMRRDMFSRRRENMPLPSLVELDDKTQKEVLESPDFLRMTVVRNPYTRLVSAWRQRVLIYAPGCEHLYCEIKGHYPELGRKSLVSFQEFVDYIGTRCDLSTCNGHWRRQVDHTFIKALNFSHIGRLERMEETVQRFQHHLGLGEPFSVGRRNTTAAGNVDFTQSLADKVYSLYREDFEAFGYDRNDWPRPHNGDHSKCMVPEEMYFDEIIERNIVIARLDEKRRQLLRRTPSAILRSVYKRVCNKFRRIQLFETSGLGSREVPDVRRPVRKKEASVS